VTGLAVTLGDVEQGVHTGVVMIVDKAIKHPRTGIQGRHRRSHESGGQKGSDVFAMAVHLERLSMEISCKNKIHIERQQNKF